MLNNCLDLQYPWAGANYTPDQCEDIEDKVYNLIKRELKKRPAKKEADSE